MPTKTSPRYSITRLHFLLIFWMTAGVFFALKCAFPEIAGERLEEVKNQIVHRVVSRPVVVDSITLARIHVDSLMQAPRNMPKLLNPDGTPVRNKVTSIPGRFQDFFPDLNDVQLATAQRLGQESCEDREEAARRRTEYVYIGASPFYDIEHLSHSIPYLVPRAAMLLDEIGRSFLDSLASKGIPFHKMVVTSVLRTNADIKRLRRHNGNASEQSCHRFGTTFDISYNVFHRVQDPDLPPQPETWAVTLKSVLAEVLADQRRLGTCWVKYEYRQSCFHITCR